MKSVKASLWQYNFRKDEIRKLERELEELERKHADETRADFGIAHGDIIGIENLVEIISRVTGETSES